MRKTPPILLLAGVTAAVAFALIIVEPQPPAVALPLVPAQADGAQIYNERCSACHQPGGVGIPGTFPPLAGNVRAGDAGYVDNVVRNGVSGPIDVDGITYDAVMAAVDMTDSERAAVVDYVVGLAGPGGDDEQPPADEEDGQAPPEDEAEDTATSTTDAPAVTADLDEGARIYAELCSVCHRPDALGVPGTFPPLAGNSRAADAGYVDDVVRNGLGEPIEVDGVAYEMPMGAIEMTDSERAAVVAYVVGLASGDQDAAGAVGPLGGDAERGRQLFIGSSGFTEGGAACASCHQAGDVGHWGGSSLGPDLDDSFVNFGGEAGLSTWLANPPSATMQPIFADEPLTEDEIADLVAFLETAPGRERPRSYGDALILGGLAGLVILLSGMAVAGRNTNPSYAERLRSNQ
ncbi:MAG: cytochrome c [Acidimicrobiia bacterium]|nr:cytochrome c [Acidimicrobiia bacterium]